MDYPALIIPVTKVDPKIDVKPVRESFWSTDDEVIHGMCEYLSATLSSCSPIFHRSADDPEIYKDVPVGIQLVGPTLQEEVILGIGEVVDAALLSSGPY